MVKRYLPSPGLRSFPGSVGFSRIPIPYYQFPPMQVANDNEKKMLC